MENVASPRRVPAPPILAAVGAAAFALGIGWAAGYPTPLGWLMLVVPALLALLAFAFARPFLGLLVMAASTSILPVFALTYVDYTNALDLMMPPLLALAVLGGGFRDAQAQDARLRGPAHETITHAAAQLTHMVKIFFAMAVVSIVPMVFRIGPSEALDSFLHLGRSIQGVVLYPIGIWLMRTEQRVRAVFWAVLVGGGLFALVNIMQVVILGVPRAGITWVVNHFDWAVEGANEAGATMVVLMAMIVAHHMIRRRLVNYVMIVVVLFLLLLTQSRSGIVAMITFAAFNVRRVRPRYLFAGALIVMTVLAVAPSEWWARMVRSFTFTRGSFEAYTIWIRFYGFLTNLKMFAHNWLVGYGWLGGHYRSQDFNEMQLGMLGAENFYLEMAVSLGIVGFIVMLICLVRLVKLGIAVRRATPPGTLIHEMAIIHPSLMAGLFAANLTGDNFVGMVALSQLAVWCAMLVRGGHLAVTERSTG